MLCSSQQHAALSSATTNAFATMAAALRVAVLLCLLAVLCPAIVHQVIYTLAQTLPCCPSMPIEGIHKLRETVLKLFNLPCVCQDIYYATLLRLNHSPLFAGQCTGAFTLACPIPS